MSDQIAVHHGASVKSVSVDEVKKHVRSGFEDLAHQEWLKRALLASRRGLKHEDYDPLWPGVLVLLLDDGRRFCWSFNPYTARGKLSGL